MIPFINQDILVVTILIFSMVFALGYNLIKIIVKHNNEYCDNYSLSFAKAISFVMLVSVIILFMFLTGV